MIPLNFLIGKHCVPSLILFFSPHSASDFMTNWRHRWLRDENFLREQWFHHLGVSENRGAPKSSILIGFSIINHPFWGTPIFGNTHLQPLLKCMWNIECFGWAKNTLFWMTWAPGFIFLRQENMKVIDLFFSVVCSRSSDYRTIFLR